MKKTEARKLSELHTDPANVRTHNKRNAEAVLASLKKFGQQKPIVVDPKGLIVAGNATFAAAKALGWESLEVVVTDLQGAEATAYAIADNRTAELAEWDMAGLEAILLDLKNDPVVDHIATGFTDEEIDNLIGTFPEWRKEEERPEATEFRVIVLCRDEKKQGSLFERLNKEGYECRLLMS